MGIEQLISRYFHLKQELSVAYNARPWQSARIDRLADQLTLTEQEIAARRDVVPASALSLSESAG